MNANAQKLLAQILTHGAAFRPATRSESARVQGVLMALGFVWVDGDTTICEHKTCMERGLYAANGKLSTISEDQTSTVRFSDCKTLLSLDIQDIIAESTNPLMRAFRHVAERQRVIEDKLDRVLAAVEGQAVGKPTLIRKGSGGSQP